MILDFGDGLFLRRATTDDHPRLCLICLRTGDAGGDATGREDDPTLMGQIYAAPYQVLEPDFAFVVDGPDGVVGTLFGAPDTVSFNKRLELDWYPALRRRTVDPGPDRPSWRGSDWARHAIHHPDLDIPAPLAAYPSHGHIDLLPEARGRGIGRRSIELLESLLAEAGSRGLFFDVHPRNTGAQHFYTTLGYKNVTTPAEGENSVFMAKAFSKIPPDRLRSTALTQPADSSPNRRQAAASSWPRAGERKTARE